MHLQKKFFFSGGLTIERIFLCEILDDFYLEGAKICVKEIALFVEFLYIIVCENL